MSNKLFKYYQNMADRALTKRGTKESMEWFRLKLRKRKQTAHDRITEGRKSRKIQEGQMLTYVYDAKHKDKLAYWDMQPLIIVLEITKDGWYGANLHYLPPKLRAVLLYELNTKNKSLAQIKSALEKSRYTAPCLKRYLGNHLMTKPVQIPKEEWEIAIMMPFEQFVGAPNATVYRNSRNKI